MLDRALRDHLRVGVTVIVSTVDAGGAPIASRGFGLDPVDDTRLRVFLAATDTVLLGRLDPGSRLAATSGDVFTFKSVQFKGTVESLSASTSADQQTIDDLVRTLYGRIAQLQNVPASKFEDRVPTTFVTCTVRVTDIFDQSPGPHAGNALGTALR